MSWLGLDWGQVDLLGKRPLFTGKTLQLPSNQWAGKEGWEAASHFWAGFLAALTHCDLKQSLPSSVPTTPFTDWEAVTSPHLTWNHQDGVWLVKFCLGDPGLS